MRTRSDIIASREIKALRLFKEMRAHKVYEDIYGNLTIIFKDGHDVNKLSLVEELITENIDYRNGRCDLNILFTCSDATIYEYDTSPLQHCMYDGDWVLNPAC